MIVYILGHVMTIVAALMVLPFIVGLIYREPECIWFLAVLLGAGLIGLALRSLKSEDTVFYLKEGCVATGLSWIIMSLIGALPFFLSGAIPNFVNALFETVSGFTTTGASVIDDVEALSHCMLFWRSFTHWIGGMGILVFLLAIISMTGGSQMNLMRAESPGPSVGKLVPKARHTAMILYMIYTALTVTMILILVLGGMPFFDSVCTAFGTAGTGGFGVKASSMADYAPFLQWVVTIFMILFGVNFNAYYLLLLKKFKQAFGMDEVRWYLGIILVAIAIIVLDLRKISASFGTNLRDAAFQVGSIITTTGFSTVNFDLWPSLSKTLLVVLMFIGACAGSTGGGIKVSRIVAVLKAGLNELHMYVHPKSVRKARLDGKALDESSMRSILVYFAFFIIFFAVSVIVVSLDGQDLITNFTAVAATINNIGPGLSLVGPIKNYDLFSDLSKFVLMFDMLAGRLELFPLVLLFYPETWKSLSGKVRK